MVRTLVNTVPITAATLAKLRANFPTVHHHPDGKVPAEALASADVFFSMPKGVDATIDDLAKLPNLKHIQLCSAGADKALNSSVIGSYAKQRGTGISLSTAAGLHVISIPNYVVGMVINLFHQIPKQILIAHNEKRWVEGPEVEFGGGAYHVRSTRGRTAGILGYGSLGRESARLLKAHNMRIIAANTTGKATPQAGYIIPGTGDKDGSIPEAFYSTNDKASLEAFLKETDVLVACLPNTAATHYLLNQENLALLRPNAILVNIGRGNLVKSEDLIAALDRPDGLFGAAIDVTDPEPLPNGHPLWSHPKVVVTPHLSGDAQDEMDGAADILIANAERIRAGQVPYNKVDFARGY